MHDENINIGKIVLRPWEYHVSFGCGPKNETICGWFRGVSIYDAVCGGTVALYQKYNVWELKFWYYLDFLNSIYANIYGDMILSDEENEVKRKVDNFIVRSNNLLMFI